MKYLHFFIQSKQLEHIALWKQALDMDASDYSLTLSNGPYVWSIPNGLCLQTLPPICQISPVGHFGMKNVQTNARS